MQKIEFVPLNKEWDAHPNSPSLNLRFDDGAAELDFLLSRELNGASVWEEATVRFSNCSRWDWDASDDHAWCSRQSLYAKQSPKWGEFYEVLGEETLGGEIDWEIISADPANARHYLFCFRDETLDFIASDWSISIKAAA